MTPSEFYQAGQLSDAVDAAVAEVKKNPSDTSVRYFLAEMLCFAGDLERADKQLDTIFQQQPDAAMRISLFRNLIRAEIARQQLFSEGRLPEFLFDASPAIRSYLEATIALREDNQEEATQLLKQAEEQRTKLSGQCEDTPFSDFRDLDDVTAGFFEVLTSTGKYYWVPMEHVQRMEFQPPERPTDLLWRSAHMDVSEGPEGEVYLPTIYAGTTALGDEQLKLGRGTDWSGDEESVMRGVGQRTFLIGEEALPIMQLKSLEFGAEAGKG